MARRSRIKMYLAFHSYGQFFLYSWGYGYFYTEDKEELHRLATLGAKATGLNYRFIIILYSSLVKVSAPPREHKGNGALKRGCAKGARPLYLTIFLSKYDYKEYRREAHKNLSSSIVGMHEETIFRPLIQ